MADYRTIVYPLPARIHGVTYPRFDESIGDWYLIIINRDDPPDRQREALQHELDHIARGDFDHMEKGADQLELIAHFS